MCKKTAQKVQFAALLGASLFIFGCSNQSNNHSAAQMEQQVTDAMPPPPEASEESAATEKDAAKSMDKSVGSAEPSMPKERKFMRAADLKYRTPNVEKTTETIENWTRQLGGFVLKSELGTSVDNTTTVSAGSDSLLESTIYTINNNMVLRVPNQYFDTLLVRMKGTMDFLEFRKITADDVSLSMLGNKMRSSNARLMANRMRSAIDRTNKRLGDMTDAERLAYEAQNDADEAAMNNLNLQDRVDFCTVEAHIYQRPVVTQRKIVDLDRYINTSAPFLTRIADAFRGGWFILTEIFFALLNLWFLIPLGMLAFGLYRMWRVK
jgi:hypothetical protein